MELSLFSRDVIAMATAVALSHDMFDAARLSRHLRQDRAGPADRRAGVRPPADDVRVPRGPMTSGLSNDEKVESPPALRRGQGGRAELLDAEAAAYHGPGTCTFYGTANSNQMLMEIMGLHLPGATFVNPEHAAARRADAAAVKRVAGDDRARARSITPIGQHRRRDARSSTASSGCTRPAARPTTPCTWSRWPRPPGSI